MTAKHWFRHKRFGAGFSIATWQGFVATIGCIVISTLGARTILVWGGDTGSSAAMALTVVAAVILAYAVLVWRTSDRTRPVKWRWGKTDN